MAASLAMICFFPGTKAARPGTIAKVLVLSKQETTPLITSLRIDVDAINVTVITNETLSVMSIARFNATLAMVDVIFVDRFLPETSGYLDLLACHVNGTLGNDGLVMFGFMQKNSTPGVGDFTASQINAIKALFPVDLTVQYVNSTEDSNNPAYSIQVKTAATIPPSSEILVKFIPWGTCPLIDRRITILSKPAATPVITDLMDQQAIITEWKLGSGARVIFFAMEIIEHNIGFTVFPYFNYLMMICTFHAMHGYSDAAIESYEEWPWSPIPRGIAVWVWFTMIGALWVVTFWIYLKNKKRGSIPQSRPEARTISPEQHGNQVPSGGSKNE